MMNENIDELEACLGTKVIISIKANPNVDVNLRLAHRQGGFEVASLKELSLAAHSSPVYINNPSMDSNLMRAGIAANAYFIVDTLQQLKSLVELAGKRLLKPVILRCNVAVIAQLQSGTPAIRKDHFGMDLETLFEAVRLIRQSDKLKLHGFHLFAGSHTFLRFGSLVAETALLLLPQLEARYGEKISLINLGGGFAERWSEHTAGFEEYRSLLAKFPSYVTLVHEAGRAVFSSCGVFMTKVVATKRIADQHYAICDGGMNQSFLLCQTENSFRKLRQPYLVRKNESEIYPLSCDAEHTVLVGSTCSRDDVIGQYCDQNVEVGDIFLFDQCGAYHSTYTVSHFLGLKEAIHYVIS
ncbi:type III PLP-dependent enzyme domain-containing protein [Aeromonas hydrophila]|uniref:PLP-dependent decarboxylase n=1 Tax=Aeromonas hydrophila TaxID=644 RepID=UPI0018902DFB|nr:PLP-dependent decarboxylase [Aeromonas hydrophila]MBF4801478.1 PLP-dependent decarboxylase [Aeromonas hydrophila]